MIVSEQGDWRSEVRDPLKLHPISSEQWVSHAEEERSSQSHSDCSEQKEKLPIFNQSEGSNINSEDIHKDKQKHSFCRRSPIMETIIHKMA